MDIDSYQDCQQFEKAILQDDAKRVADLIAAGAPVNYEYFFDFPIRSAARFNRLAVIRELAKHGADLDVIGLGSKEPPLIVATDVDNAEAVELLLDLGANPNAREPIRGYTALFTALWRQRSLRSAEALVDHGADLFMVDPNGCNAIRFAVEFDCGKILEQMIALGGRKAKLEADRARRDRELIRRAKIGDDAGVREFVKKKADVNAISPHARFALYYAAEIGDLTTMKFLLDNGANVSLSGEDRKTALLAAADRGYREAVDLLLDAGADLLEEFIPGEFFGGGPDMDAVAFARASGHTELYEYLLDLRTKLRKERSKKKSAAAGSENATTRKRATKASAASNGSLGRNQRKLSILKSGKKSSTKSKTPPKKTPGNETKKPGKKNSRKK